MLIFDASFGEFAFEFTVEYFLKQILEAAVIGLQDGVLGRQIDRPVTVEAVIHRGAGEIADRFVEIVHPHRHARGGKIEHLVLDHLAAFAFRSEEHTDELQSLMRIQYAVFCLKKKKHNLINNTNKSYNNTHK